MLTSPSGLAAADWASASRPESSSTAPADSTPPASRRRREGRGVEEEGRIEVIAVSGLVVERTAQEVNAGVSPRSRSHLREECANGCRRMQVADAGSELQLAAEEDGPRRRAGGRTTRRLEAHGEGRRAFEDAA